MNVRNTTEGLYYTLYKATLIHTPTLEGGLQICPNTLVGVNHEGVIDYLSIDNNEDDPVAFFLNETAKAKNDYFNFVDYSHDPLKFICPGFIDTHIHASQYPNVGIGLNAPLLVWLKEYTFALENSLTSANKDKLELAKKIYTKIINKTLRNGTTCASYFTTIDTETTKLFASLLVEYGQRGFVGKVCMDHNDPFPQYQEPASDCMKGMNELIKHCQSINPRNETLVKPIVTPRFAPVCSGKMLKQLGKLSRDENLPIQTHISENKDEIKLVQKLFPESSHYAGVYDDHGLLSSSTILAHAVHLTDDEIKMIKERECSISHCPTSNTFIASGEAPVKKYLYTDKLNVSLGTDISGGFEESILGVVKHSILVSHHLAMKNDEDKFNPKLTVDDAFYMATQGGAAAVGLANTIGSIEKGKKFDAQLIDLGIEHSKVEVFDWQVPTSSDSHADKYKKLNNLVNKWVFSGDDRNCVKVWCNGKAVVDKALTDKWLYVDRV